MPVFPIFQMEFVCMNRLCLDFRCFFGFFLYEFPERSCFQRRGNSARLSIFSSKNSEGDSMAPKRFIRTLLSGFVTLCAVLSAASSTAQPSPLKSRPDVFVQLGHSDGVFSMSYSLDGKQLVSTSADKSVKVWDVESGREMITLIPGAAPVAAFFSFEGKNVWTIDEKGFLKLWDLTTGRNVARLDQRSSVFAAECSADGKYALVAERERLVYWNLVTKKQVSVFKLKPGISWKLSISHDGKYIAVAHESQDYPNPERTILVYHIPTKRLVRVIKGGAGPFRSVALSPDGKTVIAGLGNDEKDSAAKVYDVATGRETASFPFRFPVFSVAFSPDGNTAAAASYGEAILFNARTWENKGSVTGIQPVAFSPDKIGRAHV
jgi:WD40 repeat protein